MRLLRRGPALRAAPAEAAVGWLLVGLGNPGPRYEGSRHNLGRQALARLAQRHAVCLDQVKWRTRFGVGQVCGQRVCLAISTTYMNESGQAIWPLARFYKVLPERVLLAFDDLDLPLGTVRVRAGGGSGGHNGVASVLEALGTTDVPRVRLGIGRPPPGWDAADYVLSRFEEGERPVAQQTAEEGAQALESVLCDGLDAAMNRFN